VQKEVAGALALMLRRHLSKRSTIAWEYGVNAMPTFSFLSDEKKVRRLELPLVFIFSALLMECIACRSMKVMSPGVSVPKLRTQTHLLLNRIPSVS
jgi:hypothetical protein